MTAQAQVDTEAYRLSKGDLIRVNVYGHDDVSGEFDIDPLGEINYPLLGQVAAAGLTLAELREYIRVELDRDYIVDPRVTVEVLNFRPIFILGQVNAPGSYPYSVGMTMRQAVALAGGYTRRASDDGTILRETANGAIELDAEEDTLILPGDTIEIDRRIF